MHWTLAPASFDQCRDPNSEFCSTFVPMRPKKRGAQETLHARNSPPTHQIRDVTAPSRFATHPLQSVHRKRADPMCPSTQPTAGAKSPCERLTTAHRRDFTSHTPRSGVSLHVLHAAQRCASSLLTRCTAACDLTPHTPRSGVRLHFPHPAQRHVPSLLTRRAAACVSPSLTPRSSHAAQRRVSSLPHTPRSGVCLRFAHAAQRRVPSLPTRRAAA